MIRKAEFNDLDRIEKIYEKIIIYEEQHIKYTAFQLNVYPTRQTAEKALNENSLFVYEIDNEVCACIILNDKQPEEYKKIHWKYTSSLDDILVIHLLCVDPDKSKSGLGMKLINFAFEEGKRRNCHTVRLDTGSQNIPAKNLYEKMGFTLAAARNMKIGGIIPHKNHLFYEIPL